MKSHTEQIAISAIAVDVFDYVADPKKLPLWATGFAKSVRSDGDEWFVETGQGGEVFDLNSDQASIILEITHAAYRKRLSRARHRVRTFMSRTCGIVNPANPCRCEKRIDKAIEMGRVDPQNLRYADHPTRTALATVEMEQLLDAASVMRSHPDYAAPAWIVTTIRTLISTKSLQLDLTAKRDTQ